MLTEREIDVYTTMCESIGEPKPREDGDKVRCNGSCGKLFAPMFIENGLCDDCDKWGE